MLKIVYRLDFQLFSAVRLDLRSNMQSCCPNMFLSIELFEPLQMQNALHVLSVLFMLSEKNGWTASTTCLSLDVANRFMFMNILLLKYSIIYLLSRSIN